MTKPPLSRIMAYGSKVSMPRAQTMMLMRYIIGLAILLASTAYTYASTGRVALVIGNSDYKHAAILDNPVNDANDIAAALQKQNFKVIKGIDLDHAGMLATIRKFSRALSKGDVGVFFYAGHGIQVSGKNYLVPIDAKLTDSFGIDFELVRLSRIHQAMEQSSKVNIIFLDACRNNPIARNLARSMGTRSAAVGNGLAAMESGIGSLISFSTQPGNVALDGRGMRNSPYSAALAKYISEGSGDITEILIKVRRDVMAATSQQQVPWEHSALTQQFYFQKKQTPSQATQPAASSPGGLTFAQRAELAFWNSVKDSGDPDLLRSYLDQYPQGAFAALAKVLVARHSKLAAAVRPTVKQGKAEDDQSRTAETSAVTSGSTKQSNDASLGAEERRRRARLLRLRANRRAAAQNRESAGSANASKQTRIQVARAEATRSATPTQPIGQGAAANARAQRSAIYLAIQTELKRLSCYDGNADGRWSKRSHLALRRAYGSGKAPSVSDLRDLTATTAARILTTLRKFKRAHCPAK
ncbi:MAG: caspase domain-containing protein [Pseudomonadota bacterium]